MNPFIVIEALDAGGSQTQTDQLARRLKKEGYQPHQYHFPHEDRASGRIIYDKFLLNHNKHHFTKREQALLYIQDFYSRAEDIRHHMSLSRGKHVVVSDRFYTSTLAYQSAGLTGQRRQRMISWIKWLTEQDTPTLPRPTSVIFLDTPESIALKHLANKKKDFHENKKKLNIFRQSYLRLVQEEGWCCINSINEQGTQRTIKDIHNEIWTHIQPHL